VLIRPSSWTLALQKSSQPKRAHTSKRLFLRLIGEGGLHSGDNQILVPRLIAWGADGRLLVVTWPCRETHGRIESSEIRRRAKVGVRQCRVFEWRARLYTGGVCNSDKLVIEPVLFSHNGLLCLEGRARGGRNYDNACQTSRSAI
jgi:hypothetical protein